jgi:small subunit ribosomal protein S4e
MHQKRSQVSTKIPIARKGTKYVVRASGYNDSGVPVLIAVRDMLGLAKTAREVKSMIHQKLLKLNGRPVRNEKESIKIFNIFEADKKYKLSVLTTGKFTFEETKENSRICKVTNKTLVKGGKTQLTMHDGTTFIDDKKHGVNDTVEIDSEGKIKKSMKFDKGAQAVIISGKRTGERGKVEEVSGGKAMINIGGSTVKIDKSRAMII